MAVVVHGHDWSHVVEAVNRGRRDRGILPPMSIEDVQRASAEAVQEVRDMLRHDEP